MRHRIIRWSLLGLGFALFAAALSLRVALVLRERERAEEGVYLHTEPRGAAVTELVEHGEHFVGYSPGPFQLRQAGQAHTFVIRLFGYREKVERIPPGAYLGGNRHYPGPREPPIGLVPLVPVLVPLAYLLRDHAWAALGGMILLSLFAGLGLRPREPASRAPELGETSDLLSPGNLQGRVLGSYRLDTLIAQGGAATVYRGSRLPDGEPVAVKVLNWESSPDPKIEEHFTREIAVWREIHHPNVVHLYDWGREPRWRYLVLELVEGGDLRSLFDPDGVPWERALPIIRQIFAALACIHGRGIIHRDIKPENLLVTPRGLIKLTDFGIAKAGVSKRLTTTGTIVGTPPYMSPEHLDSDIVTPQSDLYSAGVICYELLSGANPFLAESPIQILMKHARGTVPPLEVELPKPLRSVVTMLLAKSALERPSSARAVLESLEPLTPSSPA